MTPKPILRPVSKKASSPSESLRGSRAAVEGLNVEGSGPISLLPYGQRCAIHFETDSTITVRLGTREYGMGYGSAYLASVPAARLGIPLNRVRIYYMGSLPAVRLAAKPVSQLPSRGSVGPTVAGIGDLIESLCDRVIEKGRLYLANSLGIRAIDINYEAANGRFCAPNGERFSIFQTASLARGKRAGNVLRAAA
jgi:CO/xanthine dehydrogenase Mo-binding subunit